MSLSSSAGPRSAAKQVSLVLRPHVATNFRVAQHNILGGSLGTPKHFPFARPADLDWPTRRERIVADVLADDPHIICLEEMDDYWTFFKPRLDRLGYDSVFAKRTSLFVDPSSWCPGYRHDGSAVFWRDPFRLIDARTVFFRDQQDRVAQLVLLTDSPPDAQAVAAHHFRSDESSATQAAGRTLLVVCTHLHWDASAPNQMEELAELREVTASWRAEMTAAHNLHSPPAVVLCGDLNNTADSDVLRLATEPLQAPADDVRVAPAYASYGDALETAGIPRSGNREIQGATSQGGPVSTTLTYTRLRAIDYILYDTNRLHVASLRALPSLHRMAAGPSAPNWTAGLSEGTLKAVRRNALTLRAHKRREATGAVDLRVEEDLEPASESLEHEVAGIPNEEFGSDHLTITAEFEWVQ